MASKLNYSNIRLMAFDMDGTLLPDDKLIPSGTLRALEKVHEMGYELCICSGRSFAGVYKYEALRRLMNYYICFEGGFIIKNTDRTTEPRLIHGVSFPDYELRIILESVRAENAMVALLSEKIGFCINCNPRIMSSVSVWGAMPEELEYHDIGKALAGKPVYIVLIYGDESQIAGIKRRFPENILKDFDIINTYFSADAIHHLVIKAPGTNKWAGIEKVINDINGERNSALSAANVMAFGDWHNDLDMIKNAGIGVAMKNAEQEILDVAAVVTGSDNNCGGVAEFLEANIIK